MYDALINSHVLLILQVENFISNSVKVAKAISFNIFKHCYPTKYKLIKSLNQKEDSYLRKTFY